jgi:hypothetical protein
MLKTSKKCSLHPLFGPPFTPSSLFQWYPQSKDILVNLSTKCWYSAFNATRFETNYRCCTVRSSENIRRSSGGAQEKERQDETQFTTKIDGFLSFIPRWMFSAFFFANLTLCMIKLRVLVLFFLALWITLFCEGK